MERKNIFIEGIVQLIIVLLGNAIYALSVKLFLLPSGLPTGGTTGMALAANYFFGCPVSAFVLIFNIVMFLLGWKVLGGKFALTTAVSTFAYPLFLSLFTYVFSDTILTEDPVLCTLFSGIGIGIGLGIILQSGASTGGMDIPPLLLNRYFKISVSGSMYVFDFLILLLQIPSGKIENFLYGILLIIVYTLVLDKILLLGTSKTELKIVSNKYDEIRTAILQEVDRGVTLLSSQGGYQHQPSQLVLSVVSHRELPKVQKLVHAIDPECFMIVSRVSEVKGRGFSLGKFYQ